MSVTWRKAILPQVVVLQFVKYAAMCRKFEILPKIGENMFFFNTAGKVTVIDKKILSLEIHSAKRLYIDLNASLKFFPLGSISVALLILGMQFLMKLENWLLTF